MYAYIKGKVIGKSANMLVLDHNGMGYEIKVSTSTSNSLTLEEERKIYTYLQIQENQHSLYGFLAEQEKACFLSLIGVSNVGPSLAIACLSDISPAELSSAIIDEDVAKIQSIKGIGLKTAKRIILELKDKMKLIEQTTVSPKKGKYQEALVALITLGISRRQAEKNLDTALQRHGEDLSVEQLITYALQDSSK